MPRYHCVLNSVGYIHQDLLSCYTNHLYPLVQFLPDLLLIWLPVNPPWKRDSLNTKVLSSFTVPFFPDILPICQKNITCALDEFLAFFVFFNSYNLTSDFIKLLVDELTTWKWSKMWTASGRLSLTELVNVGDISVATYFILPHSFPHVSKTS